MTDDLTATDQFVLTHTMLRIKEPERALHFYCEVLGFQLVTQLDFPEARFSLYFLRPRGQGRAEDLTLEQAFGLPGLLELTHNWGNEDSDTQMHSGNSDPKGFGHICLAVPDIEAACARFEAMGVKFQKRLGEGGMKQIAFIRDPDGYWIEIVQPSLMHALVGANRV